MGGWQATIEDLAAMEGRAEGAESREEEHRERCAALARELAARDREVRKWRLAAGRGYRGVYLMTGACLVALGVVGGLGVWFGVALGQDAPEPGKVSPATWLKGLNLGVAATAATALAGVVVGLAMIGTGRELVVRVIRAFGRLR